jgi:hypothetical protein
VYECHRLPWQRKLLLVGHKLLYWPRTCTLICMLNIWDANTYICTDKWLKMQTLIDNRQTLPLVRKGTPQRHNINRQTVTNIWSWEPEAAQHQDILSVITWLWPLPVAGMSMCKGTATLVFLDLELVHCFIEGWLVQSWYSGPLCIVYWSRPTSCYLLCSFSFWCQCWF